MAKQKQKQSDFAQKAAEIKENILSDIENIDLGVNDFNARKTNINLIYKIRAGVNAARFSGERDLGITLSSSKNIKGVYKATSDKSVATEHMIKGKYGEAPVDFAIVDSDGKYATGKIANQLFRQFDPDGYYQASKEAIKNNSDLKIPYSSKELLDLVDPVVKTVMDAYEAGYRNPKHIPKFDALLSYGDNIDDVLKAQEMYVKSVVGSKGKVAPNFMSSFNDLSNNAEILRLLEIPGNIKEIISDPKKMQAALNDWYINRSVLSRGVTKHSDMTFDDVLNSYTRWKKTQHYAGNAYGAGLNTVRHGMSGEYDIYGNMQQNLKYSEDNLFKFIQDVKKQVDGDIPFTPEEKVQVEDLLKKNGYNTSVRTPIDFIETLGDDVNSQALLNEFSSITGIRSVGGRSYSSNSIYASLTKEIDNELEKFAFAFTKDDAAVPKSLEMRKNYIRSNSDNTPPAVYN
ncbi:MAG: hypothetical protein EOM11_10020, partial [Erysipelotrichia bacterium]|nr:hypothetical protein [Erysipelotrichia bacterium]